MASEKSLNASLCSIAHDHGGIFCFLEELHGSIT
jgi:hypothetical protein